jgi:hypothetical protein
MRNASCRVLAAIGVSLLCATAAFAQGNGGNGEFPPGLVPAGVMVSPDGVLRVKRVPDATGALTRMRMADARARLAADMTKPSELRKISLNRLEAAIAERLAAGEEATDEMKYLAGLTQIRYVFFYPESNDIVIAGPAEGFFPDPAGRVLGLTSGKAVLELQDLVAALRAFPPEGKRTNVIAVSIDPTQEGLQNMQQWLTAIAGRVRPGDAGAIVEGLKEKLGLHNVTVQGVSPQTHFAQVMVEADYRMKLIGIGIEKPSVKMVTYIDRASPSDVARNAMQRWYFTPNYDCVRVAEDDLAMELVGQGVQLVGENELVQADGSRATAGGRNRASQAFCESFTANYPKIAARTPVYAQLKNLIDMAIVAAFIQQQDYYDLSGWNMDVFGNEEQFAIETYEAPKAVETACTAVWKGNRLMTPVGGGVRIEPLTALEAGHTLADEQGEVKAARSAVKVEGLAKGQWWWD